MPNLLSYLDEPAHILEIVVLKRRGRRLRLKSPQPIAPGTPILLDLEGEVLRGEVTTPAPLKHEFDVGLPGLEIVPESWRPDSVAGDTEESLMGSLAALNARLMFYEERGKTN